MGMMQLGRDVYIYDVSGYYWYCIYWYKLCLSMSFISFISMMVIKILHPFELIKIYGFKIINKI